MAALPEDKLDQLVERWDLVQQQLAAAPEQEKFVRLSREFAELDPVAVPGVLVAGHGPFTWGRSVQASVTCAVALEAVARAGVRSVPSASKLGASKAMS